jgi:23S rRNA G2445 N2-methylase RlmL
MSSGIAATAAGAEAIAPAMSKSTVELKQTLLACDDKKDKRQRDLLGVEERKLHIEEAKTEISRAGVAGLITAVNNLASAIVALSGDKSAAGDTAS